VDEEERQLLLYWIVYAAHSNLRRPLKAWLLKRSPSSEALAKCKEAGKKLAASVSK